VITNQLTKVHYGVDEKNSARFIIPTTKPTSNVKAIEVTNLSNVEREKMVLLVKEYNQYVSDQQRTIFSFDNWIDHTGHDVDVEWRTFRSESLTEID